MSATGSSLSGRHALVTGGGRGIGRAVAARLRAEGARVTILGRSADVLARAVAEGAADAAEVADVTDEAAVLEAVRRAEGPGPVDILVANAGAAESAPFARSDADLFRRMFAVNVLGAVHVAQALLPGMTARGSGRIVAVASTAGLKGYPYVSAYCAAKHALLGLVRALAQETARTGVTINAVCPGFTDTGIVAESVDRIMASTGRDRSSALASLVKHNPQGRLVAPEEIADAVLWLSGAVAGAVTGQAIVVAGGEV